MKKFDYSNNREFMLEVLLHATDPDIKKTNKKLYNDLISLLHERYDNIPAGTIVDTLKLLIFEVIRHGMQEEAEFYDERERESLK